MTKLLDLILKAFPKAIQDRPWILMIAAVVYLAGFTMLLQINTTMELRERLADTEARALELQQALDTARQRPFPLGEPQEWRAEDYSLPDLTPEEENLYRSLLEFARFAITQEDYATAQDKLIEAQVLADTVEVKYLMGFTAWGKGDLQIASAKWLDVATTTSLSTRRREEAAGLALRSGLELGHYEAVVRTLNEFQWLLYPSVPPSGPGTIQITGIDPPSPSPVGTCLMIGARVEWYNEFRAMRIRFGSESWQESAEIEFVRAFCTGHLALGSYIIRVEVASQGDNAWSNPTVAEVVYELIPSPRLAISQVIFNPPGGAEAGQTVGIHIKVESSNLGAIRINVPCGGITHLEHTVPEYDTTWFTGECDAGIYIVRVCARHVDDPNWENSTCTDRPYELSSPPPP